MPTNEKVKIEFVRKGNKDFINFFLFCRLKDWLASRLRLKGTRDLDTERYPGAMRNITYYISISSIMYLKLDLVPLVWCLYLDFTIAKKFIKFHIAVRGNCFLFGQLDEVKRIFTPGPSFLCNGQIFYSVATCGMLIWIAMSVILRRKLL